MGIPALPICQITLKAQKPSPIPQNPQSIGEHIRKRRLEQNLFQKDVAHIIGVEETSIYNWEKNLSKPSITYVPKIIEFLGYIPFQLNDLPFGDQIKLYRKLRGISQKYLAKEIDIDPTTLAKWEANKRNISQDFMFTINDFFRKLFNKGKPL